MRVDSAQANARRVARSAVRRTLDPARLARARQFLDREGLTVPEWARRNGFAGAEDTIYKILQGVRSCRYGKAHRIAVALGLKDGPND